MIPIQPYQRGLPTFTPGHALANMIAGRDMQGRNPQDLPRLVTLGSPGALARLIADSSRPIAPYPMKRAVTNR